jgi:hypothetical protein
VAGRHREVHEADGHLFPALFAETHFGLGVRIGGIVGRVVEVGGVFEVRPGWDRDIFDGLVGKLPVEIVFRNAEQRSSFAGGLNQAVFEILAAEMCLREERAIGGCGSPFATTSKLGSPGGMTNFELLRGTHITRSVGVSLAKTSPTLVWSWASLSFEV